MRDSIIIDLTPARQWDTPVPCACRHLLWGPTSAWLAATICPPLGYDSEADEQRRHLTLQVIGEAVLSLPPDECDRVFPSLYLPVMEESNARALRPWRCYLPGPSWWQYRSRIRRLDTYITALIRQRWQQHCSGWQPEDPDLLDKILSSIQANKTAWSSKIEQQLCFEMKTFLLAGHETSAAMLTWTLLELCRNPELTQQVRQEAVQHLAEGACSVASIDRMAVTLACLKETLRRYSVVPVVTRKLLQDDELEGFQVPAGTYIACCLRAVHDLWKQPASWLPHRFLPGGEYESFDDDVRPFMFVPFIQGPRNCLGQNFSLLESRIVLGQLLSDFSFSLAPGVTHEPKLSVIPLAPANGLPVYAS
ncbi:hypothetical protein WJX84_006329 [Apatococcus fuscideae]|uniref:Cytochrome P450 n=1 Tax=Apatococcus fuscideae TaxID=2026836 RepID=A0AAW1SR06_9CHLO